MSPRKRLLISCLAALGCGLMVALVVRASRIPVAATFVRHDYASNGVVSILILLTNRS